MIQQKTILKVSDNSGAKTVKCLKILNGFKKKYAKLGDIIVVSIQRLRNKLKKISKVKKKEIYKALIIRTKTKYRNKLGNEQSFDDNAVVLLNKQKIPLGSRVVGVMCHALRKKNSQKLFTISTKLV